MNKKGFTLIEVLAAVVIVGILSAFVIIQTNSAINSGKDTKRKADIELLANAVVSYSAEHYSSKPITPTEGCTINGTCPPSINDSLNTYLATLPADPNSGSYYTYQSDGSDCTISASLSNGTTYQYSCDNQQTTTGTPTSGVCGSSNTQGFYTQPTSNFCSDGTIPTVSGTGPWTWSCPGTYLGSDANCTAYLNIDGVCGSSNNTNVYNTSFLTSPCSVGTASAFSGSGPWTWNCTGSYNGANPTCTANKKVDGVCGSSNGSNTYTIPTASLCSTGTASSVSGSGPWTWTCAGENTGATSGTCTANKKVDGVCTTGLTYYTTPSSGSCVAGTATSVAGTGPWTWGCNGINSGTSTSSTACSALKKVDGVCGGANGSYYASAPTSSLCNSGTASASGSWSWTCVGANGGASPSCSAYQRQSCSALGGSTTTCGSTSCCRLPLSSCPVGWSYTGYTTTVNVVCACTFSGGTCGYCYSGSSAPAEYVAGGGSNYYYCYDTGGHSWGNGSAEGEYVTRSYICSSPPTSNTYRSTITEIGCY